MKRTKQILLSIIALVFSSVIFNGCVDKDYDEIVTSNVDPDLTPTHTIAQFQTLVTGNNPLLIDTDYVIAGVVTGDDLTGNIYKKLILQDSLSGIAIQLDISNFNTEYPTGRKVFVKTKGLYLQKVDGNFQLGTSPEISSSIPMGRIPATLATKYLVKGKWGQYLTPKVYALNATNIPTNTLVQFNDVEFADLDYGVPYANSSVYNRTIEDCAGIPNTLIVYSSSYCTFASSPTPGGKGSIVGVYTLYNGDGELQIRDTTDVNMHGLRCNQSTGNVLIMALDSIRLLDPGAGNTLSLPSDRKIRVTVTSDYSTGILTAKNAYVQDSTAAIQVRFTVNHTYAVGAFLEINISGLELSTFSGVLQINNIPPGKVANIGPGLATPRITTIADINANFATWESQLVTITGATITGSGIYSGSNTLTDATGNIELFTSSFATFASDPYPTGTVSVTGILTEYNGTKEILIRNPSDVQ